MFAMDARIVIAVAGFAAQFISRRRELQLIQSLQYAALGFLACLVFRTRGASTWVFSLNAAARALLDVCTFLAAMAAGILHYRLFAPNHPLHNVPGPLKAKVSQTWLAFVAHRGKLRHTIQALHQ